MGGAPVKNLAPSGAVEADTWAESVISASSTARPRRSMRLAYSRRAYHTQPLFVSGNTSELWCESCGSEAISVNGATVCRSPTNHDQLVMPTLKDFMSQNMEAGVSTRCYCTTCGSEAVLVVV